MYNTHVTLYIKRSAIFTSSWWCISYCGESRLTAFYPALWTQRLYGQKFVPKRRARLCHILNTPELWAAAIPYCVQKYSHENIVFTCVSIRNITDNMHIMTALFIACVTLTASKKLFTMTFVWVDASSKLLILLLLDDESVSYIAIAGS